MTAPPPEMFSGQLSRPDARELAELLDRVTPDYDAQAIPWIELLTGWAGPPEPTDPGARAFDTKSHEYARAGDGNWYRFGSSGPIGMRWDRLLQWLDEQDLGPVDIQELG